MTREEMIKTYELFSKADAYQFGFEYHGDLYSYYTNDLNTIEAALKFDRTSEKRGGYAKIRVRFSEKLKVALIENKKAVRLGNVSVLNYADKWNKGEHFEHYIHDINGMHYEKDRIPFYVMGDIELNGLQIQLKYNGATLAEEPTLMKLLARA